MSNKFIKILVFVFSSFVLLTGCGKTISIDEAKDIALSSSKLNKDDITFIDTYQNGNDFIIEFSTKDERYIYEVKKDGNIEDVKIYKINENSIDNNGNNSGNNINGNDSTNNDNNNNDSTNNGNGNNNTNNQQKIITYMEAQSIALDYFKLSLSDVKNIEVEQEYEFGTMYYEVSFNKNRVEYSVDISQYGVVIKSEIDY